MENLFQCGRLLEDVKAVLKAEKSTTFGKWCEQFCGFSERFAFSYCSLYNNLRDLTKLQRAAVFKEHQSQRAVSSFLADNRKPEPQETVAMSNPDPKPTTEPAQPALYVQPFDIDEPEDAPVEHDDIAEASRGFEDRASRLLRQRDELAEAILDYLDATVEPCGHGGMTWRQRKDPYLQRIKAIAEEVEAEWKEDEA